MRITDLLPWKRKKTTSVPVKVRERPIGGYDGDAEHLSETWRRWFGLAPLGAFSDWRDIFGPPIDIVESEEGFRVTIKLPGLGKDNIDATLTGDTLTVQGEKQDEEEHRGRSFYRLFHSQQAFQRSIVMPCPVDALHVEASLRRGMLTVSLPKADGVRGRDGYRSTGRRRLIVDERWRPTRPRRSMRTAC